MDAFYASVEQRERPELKGKPVAVGGAGPRGVVAAASYEARKFGVFSAMSSRIALQKCPQLIFVRPDFEKYKLVSRQIREIFEEYTDLIEPLSLDEAYLDVTENKFNIPSAILIARQLKQKIREKTQLTASAGVSFNKFLAKIASDYNKPDGLFVILPEQAEALVEKLPIEKFHGIGNVTARKMKKMEIFTGGDLKKRSKEELIRLFGKNGAWYHDIVHIQDHRKVSPDRIRKSIGSEYTYDQNLLSKDEILVKLDNIAEGLFKSLEKRKIYGKTLTLKIKFSDFQQITRSKTLPHPVDSLGKARKIYSELIKNEDLENKEIRLLGMSFSNLHNHQELTTGIQLSFDF